MPKHVEGLSHVCILLYVITINLVGMSVVTCLTARNEDNRKRTEHLQRKLRPKKMEETLC
jgi:hydroxymethylpyrimidine/phosphomethylpyrimidine kinase